MARGDVPTEPPVTRVLDWGAIVREIWGDEWMKKDIVYRFSNGRVFRDSAENGGPYSGTS